ncbi:MAG: Penicillin-binding protein 2 [Candidatus Roizmanbacteria bacterium GW2011_GWC1_37_12]|nr:MAG: Penicillin-binding protein 2 [Candidatus Roizmanbacteria bacterium GW2011_GWC1_37_12]
MNKQSLEIYFFAFLIFIGFSAAALILRLFQLTIVKGQYYRNLSENNRIKEFLIDPKRGEILDRKGYLIVKNIDPNIETSLEEVRKNDDRIISKRIYETPLAVAPLIGYRQLADENDLKKDACPYKLSAGDKIGKKGVEKVFDCVLKGRPGKKLVETDAQGKFLKTLNIIPPINGQSVKLALDWKLQTKAYELLDGKKGAIAAVIPKTGEILALASSPSFNPEDFENSNDVNIEKYLADKDKPLFNRTTEGVYPPGSLFKLITATAALEEKVIDEKTLFEDKGTVTAGPLTFGNWYFLQYGKTEGMVDIVKAIKRSNDIFFYLAGEKTGVDKIKKWAEIFGLGRKTNIGLDEAEGIIPSTFWKEQTLKDRWYTGDTYNFAIGQGYIGVTPLQTLMVTSVFANGGYLCKPELLKYGQDSVLSLQKKCKKLPVSQKTIDLIREGMKQACSTGGTGWPLFDFSILKKIQVACKTGTAESHAASGLPHAWITAYAPFDSPEIALTVLVEEGGQGSDVAGPIAKELLKTYFERSQ